MTIHSFQLLRFFTDCSFSKYILKSGYFPPPPHLSGYFKLHPLSSALLKWPPDWSLSTPTVLCLWFVFLHSSQSYWSYRNEVQTMSFPHGFPSYLEPWAFNMTWPWLSILISRHSALCSPSPGTVQAPAGGLWAPSSWSIPAQTSCLIPLHPSSFCPNATSQCWDSFLKSWHHP